MDASNPIFDALSAVAYPGTMQRSAFVVLGVASVWLAGVASAAAQSSSAAQQVLVYARDPVQTPQPELAALPLAPDADRLRHPWLTAHSCIDSGALGTLPTGQRVRVCSIVQSASRDAQGRFAAAPAAANAPASAPDPFAEQMLFYHGARTLRFFADLGLAQPEGRAPVQLIANVRVPAADALQPWRDASFVRAGEDAGVLAAINPSQAPAVYFGQDGELRVAYDSAAIRHELAHAALAAWLPRERWFIDDQGTNHAPAAITEALADYFAAAIANDPRLGVHAGHGVDQPLTRNLHARLDCPAALSGAPHQDGLLLASALWAARKELGKRLDHALAAALKALRSPAQLTEDQLLQRVLARLGAQRAAAASIFRERGLTPACRRVLDLQPEQSFSGMAGRLVLPGTTSAAPLSSSVLQLRAAAPAGAQVELRMRTGALRVSTQEATLSPYRPALLVSHAPIRWTKRGGHNATLLDAAESGPAGELRFLLPAVTGPTLYFQVVNRGQRPGWFDAVRLIVRR